MRRPVADIADTAQAALWRDPFSVWVYEIRDGTPYYRPAGFTPAEWEAHQQKIFGKQIADDVNGLTGIFGPFQDMMETLLGGLAPVFADLNDAMMKFGEAFSSLGIAEIEREQ